MLEIPSPVFIKPDYVCHKSSGIIKKKLYTQIIFTMIIFRINNDIILEK